MSWALLCNNSGKNKTVFLRVWRKPYIQSRLGTINEGFYCVSAFSIRRKYIYLETPAWRCDKDILKSLVSSYDGERIGTTRQWITRKRSYIPIVQAYPIWFPSHIQNLVRIMWYKKALYVELPWQLEHEELQGKQMWG